MKSRFTRALAAGAALFTLTGCMQADFGLTLDDDESGEFTMHVAVNGSAMGDLGGMFDEEGASADPCADIADDFETGDPSFPDGATAEPFTDGDWCGVDIAVPFDDYDEMQQVLTQISSDGDSAETFGALSLTRLPSGGYRFESRGMASSGDASTDVPADGPLGGMFEAMMGEFRVAYDIRLPGRPLDHNADSVEGNRFRWTLKFGDARTTVFAETEPGSADGGSGLPTWAWVLIGVAAAAVVAGVVVVVAKRGKGAPPEPGQPSPGYQAPATVPPPPVPSPGAWTPTPAPPPPPGAPAVPDDPSPWAPPPG